MTDTVYEALRAAQQRFGTHSLLHIPHADCATYSEGAVDISYGQMLLRVDQFSERYRDLGYGPGHRFALVLENRPAFLEHWYALNRLGVSVVPFNAEMTADETAYLLRHSDCLAALCVDGTLSRVRAACERSGLGLPVVDVADLSVLPAAATPVLEASPGPATECAVLYTSGSTGKPKGCILSNEYFLAAGDWYRGLGGLCALERGCERLLTPLPLTHMNAMACSHMAMLMSGGCVVQLDRFHPDRWWRTVCESRATIIHYLGVMPAMLMSLPERAQDREHCLKFGLGSNVSPHHHLAFEERFGFPLVEGWAQTESGCAGAIMTNHPPRHRGTACIGRPSPGIRYKLVDEIGREVSVGEPGELLLCGAGSDSRRGFFTGYLKDPEATDAAWEGGYLHTGDVVREGDDGQLFFVDRRKNIIRRSGENISALEVEVALTDCVAVAQAAVAAVPDTVRGEEVMAAIVLRDGERGSRALADQIVQHCLEVLSYYKVPGYITFFERLPLTPSQKPRRAEVRRLCEEAVLAGDCFDMREWKRRLKSAALE